MKKIPLTQGMCALVSDEDYDRVSSRKWCLSHSPNHSENMYAVCKINGKTVGMHRFILNANDGLFVDHKNGNGLDNRRANLRNCTRSQNRANSNTKRSLPKGVYARVQRTGTVAYRAQIRHGGTITNLGTFPTIDLAAAAYTVAAVKMHGEFANFKGACA